MNVFNVLRWKYRRPIALDSIFAPSESMAALKIDDIAAIPAVALTTMTVEQFKAIVRRRDRYLCAGFAGGADRLSQLQPALFAELTASCVSISGTLGWRSITDSHMARIPNRLPLAILTEIYPR